MASNRDIFIMKKYKYFYAKRYGITIPKDYDIHHIDGDRENNSIGNLILLPKVLHQALHRAWEGASVYFWDRTLTETKSLKDMGVCERFLGSLIDLSEIMEDIAPWVARKWYEERKYKVGQEEGEYSIYNYNDFRL